MLGRSELAWAARGTGCTFDGSRSGPYWVGSCPDNRSAVALLDRLAWIDAARPDVGELARSIVAGARSELDAARAIHRAVRDGVRYVDEEEETFRGPEETIAVGGDCDDSARLVAGLARAIGIPAELVYLRQNFASDDHVAAKLAGQWAECTIAAHFGEDPYRAAKRLGTNRKDLPGRRLAGVKVHAAGPTPRDVQARAVLLEAWTDPRFPPPTPYALQAAGAWARIESFYGAPSAWAKKAPGLTNSHNWGAVQCSSLGPDCVQSTDKNPDSSEFAVGFKVYPSDVAGAHDFLRHFYALRPSVAEVARREGSAIELVRALHREKYFGGFCPGAVKHHGPLAAEWAWIPRRNRPYPSAEAQAAGEACDREAQEIGAAGLLAHARAIAQAHGESLAIPESSPSRLPLAIAGGALALGVGLGVQWWRGGWPWI